MTLAKPQSLFKLARSSKGLQQSVFFTAGNMIALFISAAGLIVISRSLGPAGFSVFSSGFALSMVLARFFGLGLYAALPKLTGQLIKDNNHEKHFLEVTQTGSRLLFLSLSVLIVAGVIFSTPIANLLNFSSGTVVILSVMAAAVVIFFEYVAGIFQAAHAFGASAGMMVVQALMKVSIAVSTIWGSWFMASHLFGLFYSSPLLATLLFVPVLPMGWRALWPKKSAQYHEQLLAISKHTLVLLATTGLIEYLDILFVQKFTDPVQTGEYGGVAQLAIAVVTVGVSLGVVFNNRVAHYHQKADIDSFLKKSLVIVAAAVVGLIVYIPLTDLSIMVTVGPEFLGARSYLPILMASGFLTIASAPYIALFYSFKNSRYFSQSGLGQLIIMVVSGLILVPWLGATGAAYAKLATKVFLLVFTLIMARREYQKQFA